MPIHIGKIIQAEVERQRFTQKEFGALINKNEKTIPDIYNRSSVSTDLLVAISAALKMDLISLFYGEEPMKGLRDDEITRLSLTLQTLLNEKDQLQKELTVTQKELTLTQTLVASQKDTISIAKERIELYKSELANLSNNKTFTLVKQTG